MNRHWPRRTVLAAGVACTAAVFMAACGPDDVPQPVPLPSPSGNTQPISRANLAHLWPLTVDAGTLMCRDGEDALFVAEDGTAYALNGQASQHGYASISAIEADGAHLGAMRSLALKLCSP